jgi:hypothetical protein
MTLVDINAGFEVVPGDTSDIGSYECPSMGK